MNTQDIAANLSTVETMELYTLMEKHADCAEIVAAARAELKTRHRARRSASAKRAAVYRAMDPHALDAYRAFKAAL